MSYNRSNPAIKSCSQTAKFLNKAPIRKPYCKVCHDAGKPESDYTSHYVRSLPDKQGNSKVLCPTLLNTECRFCFGLGHTAKFCPAIAAKQKTDDRNRRNEERLAREPLQQVKKPDADRRGGFSVLIDDAELDTPSENVVKEEFPALGAPSQRVQIGGYAAAASKPIPIVAAKPTLPSGFQVLQKGAAYEKTEPEPVKKPTFVARMITRWAEWDTDDENEEDRRYVDNSAWD